MAVFNKSGNALKCIKSIAHRGYSATAPENTIPAYELAKTNGYTFVECDMSLTSDGVPMLLHDSTIDRTSNGSGTLSQMTYSQVRQYDFGSWKSEIYAGTVIPTLAEFLEYCAENALYPYLELKENGNYTEAQVQNIVDMVESYNLKGNVTYISFSLTYLQYVKNYDSAARLGYIASVTASTVASAQSLKTSQNEVFIDSPSYDSTAISLCGAADVPLEYWTLSDISSAISLGDYISGATANGGYPSSLESYQEVFDKSGVAKAVSYLSNGIVQ